MPRFLRHCVKNVALAAQRELTGLDALVVLGNDFDIDPKRYIQRYAEGSAKACIHPHTKNEMHYFRSKARARYEDIVVRQALACGMPLLGICGGMHRINVICGGTLHQHIADLVGCDKHMQHKKGIAPHIPVMPIILLGDTTLAHIGCHIKMPFATGHCPKQHKVIMENSMHHQSVDHIAPPLRVCAVTDAVRNPDGTARYLAEAFEAAPDGPYAKQWILGVQWHPEFGASSLGQKIVRHMIGASYHFKTMRRTRLFYSR